MKKIQNEENVLQSFYEERRNRGNAIKKHSLLQKNLSYFTNTQPINFQPSDKYVKRKSNLSRYEETVFGEEVHRNKSYQKRSDHKSFTADEDQGNEPLILLAEKLKQTVQQSNQREQTQSPSFNFYPKEQLIPEKSLLDSSYHFQKPPNHFKDQKENKIHELTQRIIELENQNRIKSKFIESINDMRKKIEQVEEDCSLKDLWRWVKKLPNRPI